jgi:predicted phosphoribosyltransferase
MRFRNRDEAAALLARELMPYRGPDVVVLGVPRGGVPMAGLIATRLGAALDVVLVRKLRAPGQPELAIGAIDERGSIVQDPLLARLASPDYLHEELRTQQEILRTRRERYTRARGPAPLTDRTVILVDDGLATGATMLAAVRAVRARQPRRVIVAVGVAPPETVEAIEAEADAVVCLHAPREFGAVGAFYDDFSEVTDDMVVDVLAGMPTRREDPQP